MKLTVIAKDLKTLVSNAQKFSSTRANLPILSNIKLEAKGATLLASSTDLEIAFSGKIGAQIEVEGETAVPARIFSEFVGGLPGRDVALEIKDNSLLVSQDDSIKASMATLPLEDFPEVSKEATDGALSLPVSVLVSALNKTNFAIGTDESRPTLTGCLFIFREKEIVLVSTDGFRLSQKKIKNEKIKESENVIVPKRALQEISKLATSDQVFFENRKGDHEVVFRLAQNTLATRVIEGEFPNYERIIPKSRRARVEVSKDDFLKAVKLASVFARENANLITLSVFKDKINIASENSKYGTQNMDIMGKVEGEEVSLAFNYRFVEEVLNVISGDSVEVHLGDSQTAGVFLDPKDPDFLHLIMPVRG